MLTQADLESRFIANITDADILQRYYAGDPSVVLQVRTISNFLSLLSVEIDVATIEPFNKTRDRSIIADAANKGILPIATACQHVLLVINNSGNSITLSQGRLIEDNSGGRPWRLMQSITVAAGQTGEVTVEQSEYREVEYTVPVTEPFHSFKLLLSDGLSLANVSVVDAVTPTPNSYPLKIRWMNAMPGDYAVNVTTDSFKNIFIQFGDDERAGRTAQANDVFKIGILETYGDVDATRLKDASLVEVLTADEQKVSVRFKSAGLVRSGADPLGVSQLRLLAGYPALYDENAVFLENFDFLVRRKFMARTYFIAVWNENIHERYYPVSIADINHLHIAVVAKNTAEQVTLETEVQQLIGNVDSLYRDRVIVSTIVEKPFEITITGRLAAVHDIDSVKAQITGLLIAQYGRSTLAASRWLPTGFNAQEMATMLRNSVPAFQDRISDFTILATAIQNKPHEWIFVTEDSITINLERTAESGGAGWIL